MGKCSFEEAWKKEIDRHALALRKLEVRYKKVPGPLSPMVALMVYPKVTDSKIEDGAVTSVFNQDK